MGIEKPSGPKRDESKTPYEIYEDPYELLGIPRSASDDEVIDQYHATLKFWDTHTKTEVYDVNQLVRVRKALRAVLIDRGLLD
jgi:preprotein translocase subunit Sec63